MHDRGNVRLPVRPRAILFDFDGVILDSTELKVQAFAEIYRAEDPVKVAEVVAYQRYHGGISRTAKFAHFERDLFGRSADPARIEELSGALSAIVLDKVLAAPFIPGAVELLEAARGRSLLYVVSGTPQPELRHIVAARGLSPYFTDVIGGPTTKPVAFARILGERGLAPSEVLAIGDAITECDAAAGLGIAFLGVRPAHHDPGFPPDVPVVDDLAGLGTRLGFH
jgi:phosphoglycolate phosphatase-like HAD superfamily hydrolase